MDQNLTKTRFEIKYNTKLKINDKIKTNKCHKENYNAFKIQNIKKRKRNSNIQTVLEKINLIIYKINQYDSIKEKEIIIHLFLVQFISESTLEDLII